MKPKRKNTYIKLLFFLFINHFQYNKLMFYFTFSAQSLNQEQVVKNFACSDAYEVKVFYLHLQLALNCGCRKNSLLEPATGIIRWLLSWQATTFYHLVCSTHCALSLALLHCSHIRNAEQYERFHQILTVAFINMTTWLRQQPASAISSRYMSAVLIFLKWMALTSSELSWISRINMSSVHCVKERFMKVACKI